MTDRYSVVSGVIDPRNATPEQVQEQVRGIFKEAEERAANDYKARDMMFEFFLTKMTEQYLRQCAESKVAIEQRDKQMAQVLEKLDEILERLEKCPLYFHVINKD